MKVMVNTSERPVTQTPRKCLETHTDAIFVCGGQKALCFFLQNNLWYRLADTLLEHEDHADTQFREKIYITGGQSGVGNNSHVTEFYIPSANSWVAFQRKNTLTSFTSLTVLKDCLYATAGGPSSLGQTYKCNPEENYWEVLEGQPQYDQRGSCVVADDKPFYIIGGSIDLFTALILVVRFDPVESTCKWEQISPMNEERLYAFGVARNGMIYVAGGQERHRTLNTCEVYNPATDQWHIMPRLKIPRRSASMLSFKEELYVIGGFRDGQATVCELSVEGFDFETNEWKKKSHIPVKDDTPQQKEKNDVFKGTPGRIYRAVIAKLKPLKSKLK